MPSAPTGSDDRRFAGDAWKSDPRFDAFKNGYLAYSKFLQDSVEQAPVDEKMKDQMRFAMRQYVDAMSPANFLASNPEAMQLALETGGRSLVEGTELFFKDLQRGRVSSTDETAFDSPTVWPRSSTSSICPQSSSQPTSTTPIRTSRPSCSVSTIPDGMESVVALST